MEQMINIRKESKKVLSDMAKNIAVIGANTACNFIIYQEKTPKSLKKLRKF